AVASNRQGDERLGVVFRAHVAGERDGVAAIGANLGDEGLQLGIAARTHHDLGAFGGELLGGGTADAGAGARDERDLVLQTGHGNFLLSWRACPGTTCCAPSTRIPCQDPAGLVRWCRTCCPRKSSRCLKPSGTPAACRAPPPVSARRHPPSRIPCAISNRASTHCCSTARVTVFG